jgi:DNA invertase Pin-like site-specific DNA recombinase
LGENGVEGAFVRQPELSTTGPHRKLLLAIDSYFAETEREFISLRTRQGLAGVRAKGKTLGRPRVVGTSIEFSTLTEPRSDSTWRCKSRYVASGRSSIPN